MKRKPLRHKDLRLENFFRHLAWVVHLISDMKNGNVPFRVESKEGFIMISVGKYIVAHRKDGRIFAGEVVQSRTVNGDGLVVVRFTFNGTTMHRSFYLRDMESWTVSDVPAVA